jgi:hypothetical protein
MSSVRSKRVAVLAMMIILAILGFNTAELHAHGGGHGGGGHHSEHPHKHSEEGGDNKYYSYHHSHDNRDDHYHNCRPVEGDPSKEECQNHDQDWEPSAE